jgi:hypothetical protein
MNRPRNNVIPLHRGAIAHEYPDYPIGIRFVPHVPIPKPMFTADEMIIACLLSGFAGCMGTVALAFAWSWFL